MEVLPPGANSIFQHAYFEYDDVFVNYLAQSVASQYKTPLELLGLWHRHPGSMDTFSSTDDETNRTFASRGRFGTISALVNIDPQFRMTMYHLETSGVPLNRNTRPDYKKVEIEVGDDIIPEEYFELKYYPDSGLNPNLPEKKDTQRIQGNPTNASANSLNISSIINDNLGNTNPENNKIKHISNKELFDEFITRLWLYIKKKRKTITFICLFIVFFFSLKAAFKKIENIKLFFQKERIEACCEDTEKQNEDSIPKQHNNKVNIEKNISENQQDSIEVDNAINNKDKANVEENISENQ